MPARRHLLSMLEIATVGLPFCAFKLLLGSVLVGEPGWSAAGWGLTGLGLVDAVLNLVSFAAALVGRESPVGVCSFQDVVTRLRSKNQPWKELGLSLDAMLSFTLVALMIGMHLLPRLSASGLAAWNAAVVCNVLGAGVGRLSQSLDALRGAEGPR